jgi:predicted enzyme related to lactoylglutathione lyase
MGSSDDTGSAGAHRFQNGQVVYLEIPTRDAEASMAFYEKIFGWEMERPYSSFEAPGMMGHFMDDRPVAADSGVVVWIHVDRIDDTVALLRANGSEILEGPYAQGPRWLATFRDPAGNVLGIAQHGPR